MSRYLKIKRRNLETSSRMFIVLLSCPQQPALYMVISSWATGPDRQVWLWLENLAQFSSVQFSRSVVSDPLRPHELQHARLAVHHQLPEFTQTHVHRVGDAIQPPYPLSSPSPLAPNPS